MNHGTTLAERDKHIFEKPISECEKLNRMYNVNRAFGTEFENYKNERQYTKNA